MEKLTILSKHFEDDFLSLWYHGVFDDSLTEHLIELSQNDLVEENIEKSRKRITFLMAESFQNIVRHGLHNPESNKIFGVFGVRHIENVFHIYSANLVEKLIK